MKNKPLTTETGSPISDNENSLTAGKKGPISLQDHHLIDKLAHFNRERIPERVVHARGSGAYGEFEVTQDLSKYTIAHFLQEQGRKTSIFIRFSTVAGEQGATDLARDPRGFALKFYTKEGNYDMVGNNTPVFFLRDGMKFPDFIHTQKRCPMRNIQDPNAVWDFWAQNPQSLHQVTILMSDRGIPFSYRHMNGYSSHTYSFWNEKGERFWFKWHFKTDQGIKTLSQEEADIKIAQNPQTAQADLFDHIQKKEYPSWTAYIQIIPEMEAENFPNAFDVTKVWSHKDYPLLEVGKLTLNKNPDNYFAEVEQSAFSPANFVPGVGTSPDKMLQARLFAYKDAHRYRVGANYNSLEVNRAKNTEVNNYQRDGQMCPYHSPGKNYGTYDNSLHKPEDNLISDKKYSEPPLKISADFFDRYDHREDNDDYSQAKDLFHLMNDDQKNQLTENIAASLSQANKEIVHRMLTHFDKIDSSYGKMIRQKIEQKNR